VRGIIGHSLGLLLVLHEVFQTAPLFTHHLASASSISWADRALLGAVERLRLSQAGLRARLFLSVGEEDSESMTGDFALLEAQLKDRPFAELEVWSKRFPRRNHCNVLPDAFSASFGTLFGTGPK